VGTSVTGVSVTSGVALGGTSVADAGVGVLEGNSVSVAVGAGVSYLR
jgi:hypothetical protein